jgi:hypothetical protein
MRDLVLKEALQTMAGDCALCLHELLAAGEEVPYEVSDGADGSPLVQYTPKTSRFIRDHTRSLAQLDSFGVACAAIDAAELAGPYLEEMGVPVPQDGRARAELAGVVFLCRLWQGSSDFSLEDMRLSASIEELMALGEVDMGEIEIIVPLRGLQMPIAKLELAGATIVRADTIDVPNEARMGLGSTAWEPVFLAVAKVDSAIDDAEGADAGARAVDAFRRLITTLRLFKEGGVALGPHAWTRAGGDRWRRISTGSGKPRPGGYRLAETELSELATLSRGVAGPATPFGRMGAARDGFPAVLARSISRFEAGVERHAVLEALNDFLLALRFLLEGGGPAGLSLSMRVAALCAEPQEREQVRRTVDRAAALERELWSGETSVAAGESRADLVAYVEALTRAILKDAACGHLGADLRVTADEILLADGLAAGEGAQSERGETAEWSLGAAEIDLDDSGLTEELAQLEGEIGDSEPMLVDDAEEPETTAAPKPSLYDAFADAPLFDEQPAEDDALASELESALDQLEAEVERHDDAEEPSPAPRQPDPQPKLEGGLPARAENKIFELVAAPDLEPEEETIEASRPDAFAPAPKAEPDLSFTEEGETIEWTEPVREERPPLEQRRPRLQAVPSDGPVARLIADSDEHRRSVADRVGFLFPTPETTEWGVREIGYNRRRRAESPQVS